MEEIFQSYGFGLFPFETIYFDKVGAHFLEDHYLRFKRTFWILGVEFDLSFEKFKEAIERYIISAEKDYGGVRVAYVHDRLVVELKEIRYNKALFQKGFELAIARTKKDSKNILNYIKTSNIGINLIEEKRANKKGFDSCLFLNQDGFICEAAFANIFFRKDKVIYTPHVLCGLLPGIVRKKVIRISQELGYRVEKAYLKMEDVKGMDESFITSSIAGVFPVLRIENIEFKQRNFAEYLLSMEKFNRPWVC
ncbi:aminotransferase class IV [Caldicellulosiruptor acetigenus I77R1B]|uniref:Aminotransferase class IV n=1 Tax=Caldicellulosiruptor acetigenus (strain ATCC 700853 / DSM 12137 / I77R1B) TaxID=632335 RepID=E4S8K8_CALA7|nr:aminotransferase class IV [Caldicellulosiruptor acetigenus]ADQ39917.1 aminotransferase class IV [Caldicellulosiruptor acetigenus I77R1B]